MSTKIKRTADGVRSVYFNGELVATIGRVEADWLVCYVGGRYHGRVERFATYAEAKDEAHKIVPEAAA